MKHLSILSLLALTLGACQNDALTTDNHLAINVNVSVGETTRAGYSNSNLPQSFGVWVEDVKTGNSLYNNNRMTYNDTEYTPATAMCWEDENSAINIRALCPYVADYQVDNKLSVATDQSTAEGMAASDYLYANLPNVAYTTSPIGIDLNHILAKLNVNLTLGTEFAEAAKITALRVNGTKTAFTFDGTTITPSGNAAAIAAAGSNKAWEAIVVPQLADMLTVEIDIDGDTYAWTGADTLKTNTEYTFNLSVGKYKVELIDITAAMWQETTPGTPQITETFAYNSYGEGTEAKPYLIYYNSQLESISEAVNAGTTFKDVYFKQMNNIALNPGITFAADGSYTGGIPTEWTAIGNDTKPFSGHFDGDGHTVSGVYINNDKSDQGLFGYISEATIQHVGVINSYIKGYFYVGGVCGSNNSNSTVTNCYNTGTVTGSYVGGVCGYNDNSSVTNCYNTGTVTNCYNTGTETGRSCVGGVCGYNDNSSVTNCYNTGTVTNCYNTGTVTGSGNDVGGVCGYNNSNSTVTNCYNTGTVTGSNYVGGVCGDNFNNITNCYYLAESCTNGIGYGTGSATSKTSSEMKTAAFVNELNPVMFTQDTENVNNGYPVFAKELPTSIEFTVKGITFKMIKVQGGTFNMGSDDTDASEREKPVHSVTLTKDYYIAETETTQALWTAVMGSNPSYNKNEKCPVEQVSWNNIQSFITALNAVTGQTFRLPSEAEWEYAARGGNESQGYIYSGSATVNDVAWHTGNSGSSTHEVATKAANELGIYDMSGNVWEYCNDWYKAYSFEAVTDPIGPNTGSNKCFRGGCYKLVNSYCTVSYRNLNTNGALDLGFRLAL